MAANTSKRAWSIKMKLRMWRARLSIPSLIGDVDEGKVTACVAAIFGGLAILTISLVAWLGDLVLAFPALGPTAFILFTRPLAPGAAPRSVVLSHFIGIATGCAVWAGLSVLNSGPVVVHPAGGSVIFGASLSLAITALLLVRFSCLHPPACASALVIMLGGMNDWLAPLLMMAAVLLLTAQSVFLNRAASIQVPLWSPRPEAPSGV